MLETVSNFFSRIKSFCITPFRLAKRIIWANIVILLYPIILLALTHSCDILDPDDGHNGRIDPPQRWTTYSDVSISEDGMSLIFYRTKITYLPRDGYIEYDSDSTGIWVCNIDGTNFKLIYRNNNAAIFRPQFIPNSNYILFKLNSDIVKAPYNGRLIEDNEIIFLTTEGNNCYPSVNRDGSLIAFDNNNDSPNGMYFIWTMDINGNNKKRIAYVPESGEVRMPAFYPSMNLIVHIRYIPGIGGAPEIYFMDKNGYNKNRLTFDNTWDEEPRINFNDNKILYLSENDSHLIIAKVDSSSSFHSITGTFLSACWTPNDKLLYIPYLGFNINNGTIWIMNEDGSEKKQITHNYGLVLEGGN
jgi:Tol biopolymer transport system component